MTTNTRKRKQKTALEFYTLNVSAIPANHDNTVFYSKLITDLFNSKKEIIYGNEFYYKMTQLDKVKGDEIFYYGTISKYLNLENYDWETRNETGVEVPEDLVGKIGTYEFVFFPKVHKLVFIKKGKIDFDVKRKGAPLKAIKNILQIGFEQVLTEDKDIHVDIVQSKEIMERIFSTTLVKLDVELHYSNPDLEDDHGKFMDDLFRDTNSKKITSGYNGTKEDPIDSNSKLIKGTLNVARKNGHAKAKVFDENNKMQIINTLEHPGTTVVEVHDYKENHYYKILNKIKDLILGS